MAPAGAPCAAADPHLAGAPFTSAQIEPNGMFREVASYDTLDGLYDCAWSEAQETLLLAASGDGSVKLYDVAAPPMANPLRQFKEHRHEVGTRCHARACAHPRWLVVGRHRADTGPRAAPRARLCSAAA